MTTSWVAPVAPKRGEVSADEPDLVRRRDGGVEQLELGSVHETGEEVGPALPHRAVGGIAIRDADVHGLPGGSGVDTAPRRGRTDAADSGRRQARQSAGA